MKYKIIVLISSMGALSALHAMYEVTEEKKEMAYSNEHVVASTQNLYSLLRQAICKNDSESINHLLSDENSKYLSTDDLQSFNFLMKARKSSHEIINLFQEKFTDFASNEIVIDDSDGW